MRASLLAVFMVGLLTGCLVPMPVGKVSGIRKTEPDIQRRVVFASAALGSVNSITMVSLEGEPMLAVGGGSGAAFVSRSYMPHKFVSFNAGLRTTVPIDVDGNGNYEYMDRGGGWSPVKLVSADGRLLWQFPKERSEETPHAANQMAAGDLDGDGVLDFVVGMNASGGLYALAKDGSVKWWHQASNVFAVEMVDLDGDGSLEVVHIDGRHVVIRDGTGTEIRRFRFPANSLRPLVWTQDSERVWIAGRKLFIKGGALHFFNQFGDRVSTVRLPRGKGYTQSVQPVRFGGELHYAAANQSGYAYEVGYLYIFNEHGRILHEEVFTARVKALAARSASKPARK